MTRLRSSILPLSLLATSFIPLACGGSTSSPPAVCADLENYTPTSTSQLSFATDVYPILTNTSGTGSGCAQAGACHGADALAINAAGTKLPFIFGTAAAPMMDPAMAKAQLLTASVNAPGMQRVLPGSVKNSFMAYKLASMDVPASKEALSCISGMCKANASVGTPPCGDPMPTIGKLSAADRTKILDWIASGASD